MAFTANAAVGEPSTRRIPPIAGPSASATLSTVEVRVFAAARSSSVTSVGVAARTAGRYAEENTVEHPANTTAASAGPFERPPRP